MKPWIPFLWVRFWNEQWQSKPPSNDFQKRGGKADGVGRYPGKLKHSPMELRLHASWKTQEGRIADLLSPTICGTLCKRWMLLRSRFPGQFTAKVGAKGNKWQLVLSPLKISYSWLHFLITREEILKCWCLHVSLRDSYLLIWCGVPIKNYFITSPPLI